MTFYPACLALVLEVRNVAFEFRVSIEKWT